jgi:hypothetical protein
MRKTKSIISVGFTGTRHGMTVEQGYVVAQLLEAYKPHNVHSGDCVGADVEFDHIAWLKDNGVYRHGHPPDDSHYRAFGRYNVLHPAKSYIERNHDIVDVCDVLLVCPRTMAEEQRSGTWATVRYARMTRKPLVIVWPDGTTTRERV